MKALPSVIAASIAMLTIPAAHADSAWNFGTISLTNDQIWTGEPKLSLVSQSATQTVVSFDSLSKASKAYASFDNDTSYREDQVGVSKDWMLEFEQYSVRAADGYRVSSVTVDVGVKGELRPGAPNGEASNSLSMTLFFNNGGNVKGLDLNGFDNLNGSASAVRNVSLADGTNFSVYMETDIWTAATAALHMNQYNGMWYLDQPSYSNIWADSIKMTFNTAAVTSPVPEPDAYTMMIAGIAVVGGMARVRKSKGFKA